jgi:hypothetical protein
VAADVPRAAACSSEFDGGRSGCHGGTGEHDHDGAGERGLRVSERRARRRSSSSSEELPTVARVRAVAGGRGHAVAGDRARAVVGGQPCAGTQPALAVNDMGAGSFPPTQKLRFLPSSVQELTPFLPKKRFHARFLPFFVNFLVASYFCLRWRLLNADRNYLLIAIGTALRSHILRETGPVS